MDINQTSESPSLLAMISAPGFCLILGAVLLHFTETPWTFAAGGIGYSVLMGAAIGVLLYILLAAMSRLPIAKSLKDILAQLRPLFKNMNVGQILILALMAGIGEEVFFRGFLQTWLSSFMSIELAILAGAIGFGLLHFASVGYFVITTLIGLALGFTYHFSESLLLVITWHSVYDALAIWVISRYPELIGIEV